MQAKISKWCKRPENQISFLKKTKSQQVEPSFSNWDNEDIDKEHNQFFPNDKKPMPLIRIKSSFNLNKKHSEEVSER